MRVCVSVCCEDTELFAARGTDKSEVLLCGHTWVLFYCFVVGNTCFIHNMLGTIPLSSSVRCVLFWVLILVKLLSFSFIYYTLSSETARLAFYF